MAAARLAWRATPGLPAAPSLPRRPGSLGMVDDVAVPLDHPTWDGLHAFLAAAPAGYAGPVKVQVCGPFTRERAGGVSRNLAIDQVLETALDVGALVRASIPAATVVLVLDEPMGTDGTGPLTEVMTIGGGDIVGVHCCGDADLRPFIRCRPDILSIPVDRVDDAVRAYAADGGLVCLGAVPTARDVPSVDELGDLRRAVEGTGLDPELCLISPECGLALHGVPAAERALDLARWLAVR